MKKILMPIGDAVEALDTFYAYYRLPEEGYQVVVAGPEARLYHTVLHEIPPNPDVPWDITQERPGYHLQAEVAYKDLRSADYAGAFISGGRAPEYIRYERHFAVTPRPDSCGDLRCRQQAVLVLVSRLGGCLKTGAGLEFLLVQAAILIRVEVGQGLSGRDVGVDLRRYDPSWST